MQNEKRDEYARKCSNMYLRHEKTKYALSALREITSDSARSATVGEAILRAFKEFKLDKKDSFLDFLVSLADKSSNYQENIGGGKSDKIPHDADMTLAEWLKKTHKLLSNGDYKEAAENAASAPSGVLCNLATLDAFRNVTSDDELPDDSKIPILFYIEAAMGPLTSKYIIGTPFIEACVQVALQYNCYLLISSWMARKRIPPSQKVVELFLANDDKRYVTFAETLCYVALQDDLDAELYKQFALECLFIQGRMQSAVNLIESMNITGEQCAKAWINRPSNCFFPQLIKRNNEEAVLTMIGAICHVLEQFDKDDEKFIKLREMEGHDLIGINFRFLLEFFLIFLYLDDSVMERLNTYRMNNENAKETINELRASLMKLELKNLLFRLI